MEKTTKTQSRVEVYAWLAIAALAAVITLVVRFGFADHLTR
jgi:hypothetical protein